MLKSVFKFIGELEMKRNKKLQASVFFMTILIFISCAPDNNLMAILVSQENADQYYIHISESRAAFDVGDYRKAVETGEKAAAIAPGNEEVAVVLGFAYVGLAGLAPIDLVRGLVDQNEVDGTDDKANDGASSFLDQLGKVMKVNDSDILKLGELDESSNPTLPLLVPHCADKARSNLEKLILFEKAINLLCPFVDFGARLPEDYRHTCNSTQLERRLAAKSNFLWAISHLGEALIFNRVLNYGTSDSNKTNLEMRMDAVSSKEVNTPAEISSFIADVDTINKTVNRTFSFGSDCAVGDPQTQFTALLNDMVTASVALTMTPGIPESVSDSIAATMKDVIDKKNAADRGAESQDAANILKGDFSAKIAESLAAKIDSVNEGSGMTPSQLADLCASYDSISGGQQQGAPQACSN